MDAKVGFLLLPIICFGCLLSHPINENGYQLVLADGTRDDSAMVLPEENTKSAPKVVRRLRGDGHLLRNSMPRNSGIVVKVKKFKRKSLANSTTSIFQTPVVAKAYTPAPITTSTSRYSHITVVNKQEHNPKKNKKRNKKKPMVVSLASLDEDISQKLGNPHAVLPQSYFGFYEGRRGRKRRKDLSSKINKQEGTVSFKGQEIVERHPTNDTILKSPSAQNTTAELQQKSTNGNPTPSAEPAAVQLFNTTVNRQRAIEAYDPQTNMRNTRHAFLSLSFDGFSDPFFNQRPTKPFYSNPFASPDFSEIGKVDMFGRSMDLHHQQDDVMFPEFHHSPQFTSLRRSILDKYEEGDEKTTTTESSTAFSIPKFEIPPIDFSDKGCRTVYKEVKTVPDNDANSANSAKSFIMSRECFFPEGVPTEANAVEEKTTASEGDSFQSTV